VDKKVIWRAVLGIPGGVVGGGGGWGFGGGVVVGGGGGGGEKDEATVHTQEYRDSGTEKYRANSGQAFKREVRN